MLYNVAYDAPDGMRIYCQQWHDHVTAERMLALWCDKYGVNGGRLILMGKASIPSLIQE